MAGEVTPRRIQRKRTAGWRMPPNTVCVTRPGRWGNPYIVSEFGLTAEQAVFLFRRALEGYWNPATIDFLDEVERRVVYRVWCESPRADDARAELRGKNLACWCRLCDEHADGKPFDVACPDCAPCHVDVLGEIANA